ncbi:MAG: hypothetical protein M0R80_03290 [Proteobacteria bacterium]|jgi:hypothetical protein|nr:hypothetical protein [Pseudomonadota bacterium]
MEFSNWILQESSLNDLYQSAVEAFPRTTKRQHATQPIKIVELTWVPYRGVKTLFVKAMARNEGRVYNPIIVFKKVHYLESGGIALKDKNGQRYFVEQLSLQNNDVLVRCQCGDFYWRGTHFNKLDHSLYGPDRKKYEAKHNPGSANPTESPIVCKHLMKMMEVLHNSGFAK